MINKNIKTLIAFSLILLSFQSKAFVGFLLMAEKIANQCNTQSNTYLNIINKADKQLFNDNMTINQVIEVAHKVEDNFKKWGQNCQERENATYALLGKNKLNKSYVKTPISAEDAVKLVVGLRNKKNLIVHLFDKSLIKTPINFQETLKLTDSVRYGNRASFLDYLIKNKYALQSKISFDQAVDLLDIFKTDGVRGKTLVKLINLELVDLPTALGMKKITTLLGNKANLDTIKALAKKQLIAKSNSVEDYVSLLNTVDSEQRANAVQYLAHHDYLPKGLSSKQVDSLLSVKKEERYFQQYHLDAVKKLVEKNLIVNNLSVDEALVIIRPLKEASGVYEVKYRQLAIEALFNAKNPLVKTPLNAADLTKLIEGVEKQDVLIWYLSNHQFIE